VRTFATIRARLPALGAVDSVGQAVDRLAGSLDSSVDDSHAGDRDGLGVLTHGDVVGLIVGCVWVCVGQWLMCECVGLSG
jgi:hypothetical protein